MAPIGFDLRFKTVCPGLYSCRSERLFGHERAALCAVAYDQGANPNLTLLITKMSEALAPMQPGNRNGPGGTMDEFVLAQPGTRFIANGGFNHYRKDFYAWPHQDFNVGDPAGLVKIREHFFCDHQGLDAYGFLVQNEKGGDWRIESRPENISLSEKYILGSTPLLIHGGEPAPLAPSLMAPVEGVNPPSILGHGLQKHPRTAVAQSGRRLLFLFAQSATLPEMAQLGQELGCEAMLNLDGGGSSQYRLFDGGQWLSNPIEPADRGRVLGHALALFDESLK